MGQAHGVTREKPVSAEDARQVARVMAALGTASRVRILGHLRSGTATVGELIAAVEMAQPAVSHQLRILRDLGLVVGVRTGRHVRYGLHDPHVATLLDEALRHVDHLHLRAGESVPSEVNHPEADIERGAFMTDEHTHEAPHAHEHEHDGATHEHAHTAHDHEHVEHAHDHKHGGEEHAHEHVHEAGLEDIHEHDHA